jgi:hypothetical protein
MASQPDAGAVTGGQPGDRLAGPSRWRHLGDGVEVDAIQWTGLNFADVKAFASGALGLWNTASGVLPLWQAATGAVCRLEPGDWVIREPEGGCRRYSGARFVSAFERTDPPAEPGIGEIVTGAVDKALADAIATTAWDIAGEHGDPAGGLPAWQDITAIVLLAIGEHARIVPKEPVAAARPDLDGLQEIYDSLKGHRPGDQQLPVPNDGPSMHDLVIADLTHCTFPEGAPGAVASLLAERKRLGLERYSSLLQAFNGRDWLRDLREELADAAVYARQGLAELGDGDSPLAGIVSDVYDEIVRALLTLQGIPEAGRG